MSVFAYLHICHGLNLSAQKAKGQSLELFLLVFHDEVASFRITQQGSTENTQLCLLTTVIAEVAMITLEIAASFDRELS